MMTEDSVHKLIAGLVDQGCQVSPLGKDKTMGVMGESACLVAIIVKREFRATKDLEDKMMTLVKKVLKEIDAHYFSIIVHMSPGSYQWCGEAPGERRN